MNSARNWAAYRVVPLLLLSLMLLSGCGRTVIKTERIREPVPLLWLQTEQPPPLTTYAEYMAECEAIVVRTNADKVNIIRWSNDAPENSQSLPPARMQRHNNP